MSNYLIVGGTSGIGLALAEKLSSADNHIQLIARNPRNLERVPGAIFHALDITDEQAAFPEMTTPLDGLVYAPGSITLKPFRGLKPEDFKSDWELNLMGLVRTLHAYLPALKKAAHPSIVAFSTVAVAQGMPFHASIASAKAAVEGLVRSLAAELAPTIRINAVAPSLTDTPMAERLLNTDSKREASAGRHPLKRIGRPEDPASAAAWLLSDDASWVTGQVIAVDGGMSSIRTA